MSALPIVQPLVSCALLLRGNGRRTHQGTTRGAYSATVDAVKSAEFSSARKMDLGEDSVLRYRLGVYNKHFRDAVHGVSLVGSHYAVGVSSVFFAVKDQVISETDPFDQSITHRFALHRISFVSM